MELMMDENLYTRHYRSQLGIKFEVPSGASYACGSNSHNNFRYEYRTEENETISTTLTLGGIQVHTCPSEYCTCTCMYLTLSIIIHVMYMYILSKTKLHMYM